MARGTPRYQPRPPLQQRLPARWQGGENKYTASWNATTVQRLGTAALGWRSGRRRGLVGTGVKDPLVLFRSCRDSSRTASHRSTMCREQPRPSRTRQTANSGGALDLAWRLRFWRNIILVHHKVYFLPVLASTSQPSTTSLAFWHVVATIAALAHVICRRTRHRHRQKTEKLWPTPQCTQLTLSHRTQSWLFHPWDCTTSTCSAADSFLLMIALQSASV